MTWTHLKDETPRARKQYICGLCGLRIRKGARHVVRYGIDSGEGYTTFRMHAVCESHLGNVVKYVARARHKGRYSEDLRKARWYIDREIQRIEANGEPDGEKSRGGEA